MVLFNYATKELTAKVVYYGPGLCGKTTNLQFIHENLPDSVKGRMLSLATKTDRTLFFDFLPIDLGEIRGMKTRVQLYTVPGQVFYNETRRLVLKGADGIVFVADSQETMLGPNVESFRNLEENLKAHGMSLADMPHVIQFNKRDLPRLAGIEEMNAALNKYNAPFYESVATTGIGVQDTLKAVVKLVLLHLTRKYDPKAASSPRAERPTPVMAAASAAPPAPPRAPEPAVQTIPLSSIPLSELTLPETAVASRQAAPASAQGSLPLSADPLAGGPFADEEIEGLVREVDEYAPGSGTPSDDAVWMGEPVEEEPSPAEERAAEAASPFATADAAFGSTIPIEDYAPSVVDEEAGEPDVVVPDRPGGEFSRFELDQGFDPGWPSPEPSETAIPVRLEDREPLPPVRAEAAPVRDEGIPAGTDEELVDDGVYLSEVVDDAEIFEDPGLEVATLAAGEARDIVVPVEIRSGNQARRFKLSVRLRLDPVDPD